MMKTVTRRHARRPSAWAQKTFAWALHAGNRVMRDTPSRKRQLFAMLSGRVLEIGAGAGANIPLYGRGIQLICVEPNRFMFRYLREESRKARRVAQIFNGRAESLGLRENSVDAVVCTHVLCSVDDLAVALSEILRVLRPGGLVLFVEHVAAPRTTPLRAAQRLLRPLWQRAGGGCRPDRELWRALEWAGFAELTYEHLRVPRAALASPHIMGWARKPWS